MSVLALINDQNAIDLVLPWALTFVKAREGALIVVCWTESAVPCIGDSEDANEANSQLVQAVNNFFSHAKTTERPEVIAVFGPTESKSAIDVAKENETDLIVAIAKDPTGASGASYATNSLLKQSPFTTVILFGDATRSKKPGRVFIGATDSQHDVSAAVLARQLASNCKARVTVARAELDSGPEGQEIGRRELNQLMRDANVEDYDRANFKVYQSDDYDTVTTAMNEHDLVLLEANYPNIPVIMGSTSKPTVAVVKRAPPLRLWQSPQQASTWTMRLSPADYAELFQGLRRGSRLGADFLIMLSLAAIVASMGLLQNSAAVVIGSMLLAPLMTPMIGCGLALAQANQKLGNHALGTVLAGLLCTLVISFLVGVITPGIELTPQIYARGQPTFLDLIVALASAAAASYALARPNLVGSIAGVAIATALVPPLCSAGISLAYGDLTNAQGAALLFVTNFLAIVLCSAFTFRLIGITPKHSETSQKFWVFRVVTIFSIAVVLIAIPLQNDLMKSLVQTKPQPRTYPLASTVADALEDRVQREPGVNLISTGRPSSHFASSDVVIILGCTGNPEPDFSKKLIRLVREKMLDDSLVVEVHCVKELWQETSP
jgi:uncharacterized hydrophobic protein (TIGR00271 family)